MWLLNFDALLISVSFLSGASDGARWSKRRSDKTQSGTKDYYFCSKTNCKVQLQVLHVNTSYDVIVSHNGESHAHDDTPSRGLSQEAKKVRYCLACCYLHDPTPPLTVACIALSAPIAQLVRALVTGRNGPRNSRW